MVAGVPGADSDYVQDAVELRAHVARSMQERAETIITDAMAVQAFAGMGNVAPADRTRLADVIFQLITLAVREGPLDSRSAPVADLEQLMREADIDVRALFNVVYLLERSACSHCFTPLQFSLRKRIRSSIAACCLEFTPAGWLELFGLV